MIVKSNIKPSNTLIKLIENNNVKILLRRDIVEVKNEEEIMYEYEEVKFELSYREGIEESVNNNFDVWFDYGLKQMESKKNQEIKENEINRLIKNKELVDESSSLWYQNMILGNKIVDMQKETSSIYYEIMKGGF